MKKITIMMLMFVLVFAGCGAIDDKKLVEDAASKLEYKGTVTEDKTVTYLGETIDTHIDMAIKDENNFSYISTSEETEEMYIRDGIIYIKDGDKYYKTESEMFKNVMKNIFDKVQKMSENSTVSDDEYCTLTGEDTDLSGTAVRKVSVACNIEDFSTYYESLELDSETFLAKLLNLYAKMITSVDMTSDYYIATEGQNLIQLDSDATIGIKVLGDMNIKSSTDYTHVGEDITIDYPKELDDAESMLDIGSLLKE